MMNRKKFEKVESLLSEAKKNLNEAMPDREQEKEEFEYRDAYLSEFERVCERFDIEFDVELEEDESKDDVYSEWNDHVNMSASDLQKWSKNPCSREASQDPEAVIKRNLRLLERNKEDWTSNDVEDAKRTISFISRMKAQQPDSPREGPHGCPSEWAVSLLNWAFNPFDSVPSPSSEVKEDLEPVEEVTLSSELQERKNIEEAEALAEKVWMLKDATDEFSDKFEDMAMSLEEERDLESVKEMRVRVVSAIDLMLDRVEPIAEEVRNSSVEELQEREYEFSPAPSHVVYETEDLALERAENLGLDGVHEHVLVFGDERQTFYMPGSEHMDWAKAVNHPRQLEDAEMSDSRKASRVVHGDQEKHLGADKEEEDDSVQVPPVAIHKVESGSNVEVSEDVEEVLDKLWEQNSE